MSAEPARVLAFAAGHLRRGARVVVAALLAAALWGTAAKAESTQPKVRRIAVLIGANSAAAGRPGLRYAHSDARGLAEALIQVGGFLADDVHVLLDPEPDAVFFTLDRELATLRAAGGESLLLFYYSGHADGQALYPAGRPLPFRELRRRLEDPAASVRVGIVDACGGGGFTGAKGLTASAPFVVDQPLQLSGEGSALIASSSGLESAHESEGLLGSFFTHHFVAALRGAADVRGDGVITLGEAFAYAKERTVRDTAAISAEPQHPSFDMHLRGRNDLPLAQISTADTRLELRQRQGPLQVIHLATGLAVLEVPAGRRALTLALRPGRYLVRRRSADTSWAQEVAVVAGQTVLVSEEDLALTGAPLLVSKRFTEAPAGSLTTPRALTCLLSLRAGIQHGGVEHAGLRVDAFPFELGMACGLSDRFTFLPSDTLLAYRFGDRGGVELIPSGGINLVSIAGSSSSAAISTFRYQVQAHLDLRYWLDGSRSLDLSSGVSSTGAFAKDPLERRRLDSWSGLIGLGYTHGLLDFATLHFGATYTQLLLENGHAPSFDQRPEGSALLTVGSSQTVAGQRLPLVRVHVTPEVGLDGFAWLTFDLHGNVADTYMIGLSGSFK